MTSSPKVLHLACHCQTHVLRLTDPSFEDVGVCDCSHCLKRRIVWGGAKQGTLEVVRGVAKDGAEDLTEYRFGNKNAGHQFCGKCGTHLLGMAYNSEGEMMYNLRAIRDKNFDLWGVPSTLFSGIDRKPPYTHPTLSDLPGATEYFESRAKDHPNTAEIYVGACHCQAIKFAVLSKPMKEARVIDCACSICLGNGVLWLYPERQDTFFTPSSPTTPYIPLPSLLTKYTFGPETNQHWICKTCGCQIYEYSPRPEQDPHPKEFNSVKGPWETDNGHNGHYGLNIALLNGMGDYLADAHGLNGDVGMAGLKRQRVMLSVEPQYELRL